MQIAATCYCVLLQGTIVLGDCCTLYQVLAELCYQLYSSLGEFLQRTVHPLDLLLLWWVLMLLSSRTL